MFFSFKRLYSFESIHLFLYRKNSCINLSLFIKWSFFFFFSKYFFLPFSDNSWSVWNSGYVTVHLCSENGLMFFFLFFFLLFYFSHCNFISILHAFKVDIINALTSMICVLMFVIYVVSLFLYFLKFDAKNWLVGIRKTDLTTQAISGSSVVQTTWHQLACHSIIYASARLVCFRFFV